MIENTVILPGVSNARELGGYAVGEKHIKKSLLLRTGRLDNASPDALRMLDEVYHVHTVVDFRMSQERKNYPDPQIPDVVNTGLSVIEMEDFSVSDRGLNEIDISSVTDRMVLFDLLFESGMLSTETYVKFLLGKRGREAYRRFFGIILEAENGAVLWHCTDGKDRTGCAAMLLLSALGADRKTILYDYMLTNEFNREMLDYLKETAQKNGMSHEKLEALYFINGCVAESYMLRALEALDESYGGAVGYLREELGVGEAEIKHLRKKYLE